MVMRSALSIKIWMLVVFCWCFLAAAPAFSGDIIKSSDKKCSVRVLWKTEGSETAGGDRGDAYVKEVVKAGDFQTLAVQAALDQMPPLLCHSLERLVFVNRALVDGSGPPDKDLLGIVYSDQPATVYISATRYLRSAEQDIRLNIPAPNGKPKNGGNFSELVRRILHEAAHTGANLLDSQTDDANEVPWGGAAKAFAAKIIDDMRLKNGFTDEWERTHDSFVEISCAGAVVEGRWLCSIGADGFNLAKDYDPVLGGQKGDEFTVEAHEAGFSTPYGAKNSDEDIAEIALAALGKKFSGTPFPIGGYTIEPVEKEDACWRLRQEPGPGITSSVAAFFTKLAFARDVGLITWDDFNDCVGNVGHQHSGQGYFSYRDNVPSKEYKNSVSAGIGTSANVTDPYIAFRFDAEGPTEFGSTPVTGRIRLKLDVALKVEGLDAASWPRGLYLIDTETGLFGNQFWFVVPENRAGTFFARRAIVLVTGSGHEIVEGTVFVVAGFRPWAPMPVPQTGLPMKATFRAVKPGASDEPFSDDPAAIGGQ